VKGTENDTLLAQGSKCERERKGKTNTLLVQENANKSGKGKKRLVAMDAVRMQAPFLLLAVPVCTMP